MYIANIEQKDNRIYMLFISEKKINKDHVFNTEFEKENICGLLNIALKHYERLDYIDNMYVSFKINDLKKKAKFNLKFNKKNIKFLQGNKYAVLLNSKSLLKHNIYIYISYPKK